MIETKAYQEAKEELKNKMLDVYFEKGLSREQVLLMYSELQAEILKNVIRNQQAENNAI